MKSIYLARYRIYILNVVRFFVKRWRSVYQGDMREHLYAKSPHLVLTGQSDAFLRRDICVFTWSWSVFSSVVCCNQYPIDHCLIEENCASIVCLKKTFADIRRNVPVLADQTRRKNMWQALKRHEKECSKAFIYDDIVIRFWCVKKLDTIFTCFLADSVDDQKYSTCFGIWPAW